MTTSIQTRCPHCHACFNLPPTQLNKAKAKGLCGRCQQVFLVNEHIINNTNESYAGNDKLHLQKSTTKIIADNNKTSTGTQKPKPTTDTLVYNDIDLESIYDGMGVDGIREDNKPHKNHKAHRKEPASINLGSDSFDEINAWLPRSADVDTDTANSNNVKHSLNKDNNATVDNIASEPDLNQLLSAINSVSKDQETLNQERADKIKARMQPAPLQRQTSAATILWSAGCLVLALLLFAQYVIFNLDTLIKTPAHAARLQTVCSIAACSLPSADLDALIVAELSHRPSRINAADTFSDIKADLVNQSMHAQLFPNLKVSIYGANALIGEFIALPEDYLLGPQSQLGAENSKSVMFTVPVTARQISQITVSPIY